MKIAQVFPQTEGFIIMLSAKEPLCMFSATRPFSTIQFSDGKSSLQTLLTAVTHGWTEQRWRYHIKRYSHQPDVCRRRVCSRDGWHGIQLQVKEEGIMGRNDESWQDFTPWWTCAGSGRTRGCCSRTRCRTCRQTVKRDWGYRERNLGCLKTFKKKASKYVVWHEAFVRVTCWNVQGLINCFNVS